MKTVLLSTTNLWNCGDDFIREGIMNLCNFKDDVRILWWNRSKAVQHTLINDLSINLPLIDYFIVAGSPTWLSQTVDVYRYCLKKRINFSLIGVGTFSGFKEYKGLLKKMVESDLCDIALSRDDMAYEAFKKIGFDNIHKILDPAFFMKTKNGIRKLNVLCWAKQFRAMPIFNKEKIFSITSSSELKKFPYKFWKNYICKRERTEKRKKYNNYMKKIFSNLEEPKFVTVHENSEVEPAEKIFGKEYVYYSTDYKRLYDVYSNAKQYIGSRIHGFIPSFINGAYCHLIYNSTKANAIENSMRILKKYDDDIMNNMDLSYWSESQNKIVISGEQKNKSTKQQLLKKAIDVERKRVRQILKKSKLKEFLK